MRSDAGGGPAAPPGHRRQPRLTRKERRARDAAVVEPDARVAEVDEETPDGPAAGGVEADRFGARELALAAGSGLLLLVAAPPRDLWPIGLVALVPLALALRKASPWHAFFLGWLCGFVVNLGGFRWTVPVLEHFGHVSLPTRALVLLVAAAYQGAVFALWCGLARLLEHRARVPLVIAAPLAVAVAESLLPFVFPWHLAIVIWRAWPLIQVAEIGGPVAVSALVVLVGFLLAGLIAARLEKAPAPIVLRRGAAVVAAIVVLGLARAGHVAWQRGASPHVKVGVVQPNAGLLTADERKLHGEQQVAVLRNATTELGQRGAELVVWPESSFPFYFDRELGREYAQGHPWQLRKDFHGALLFGALTHRFGGSTLQNSAVLVAPDGKVAGIYDKTQLLVFGEYVPFADRYPDWAAGVRARLPDSPDIEPGDGPKLLQTGALRIGPLICYEDILPWYVDELASFRPNLLVTVANHAWFGDTEAPSQALALATLRSVETRRDLVRATMTGVSSIGDALGRVHARSGLHAEAAPPETLLDEVALVETFALGPWAAPVFPWLCAAALAALAVRGRLTRRAS